ncbi:hypothetical protein GUITHDRAFT_65244 [Guillardia theta CCMP2712]|uniref:Uncharacterized protein n=2 Tax=Guillardia theta TaxID=55529 RepID=L1JWI4_GUITC|nr:hypothetical protein GUITHDRAFT_65244 [Guillardia theta CCMP2712]EKX52694.1 hypothetical protein GUITHDRAFT_65244 [Guillardia theta CCMP2712]|eukprot:XP_005839674.1 hypothetical protein GUITHDRAFT_65244 [Guillardia theta CCMP2712]
MLRRNTYLHRKYAKLSVDDIAVCNCLPIKGKVACADQTCALRQIYVECTPGFCPCGDSCQNQRFQKCQYVRTEVKKVDKRGWALFTMEDVQQGTFVIEYMGEILNRRMYERRKKAYAKEKHTYFMVLNTSPIFEVIDASRKSSMGRFINHSCDPNCHTHRYRSLGEVVVGIFAKRDIEKGEEITIDYQMFDGAATKKCHCGAKNCKGFLGS